RGTRSPDRPLVQALSRHDRVRHGGFDQDVPAAWTSPEGHARSLVPGIRGGAPGALGHRVDGADDVDHGGGAGGGRLVQRGADVVGAVDADADTAHGFGHAGEVDVVVEVPHFGGAAALLALVGGVEQVLFLVQGVVVVDQHDRVDSEARG